jgi:hypothetical protein
MRTIHGSKRDHHLVKVCVFLITAALIAGMAGCDGDDYSQNLEIWDWYDLNAVRNNLDGNHTLMNDLDSTTAGYTELAGPAANGGKGWEPLQTYIPYWGFAGLRGTFDGQGHEIRDLFINRPDENGVALFSDTWQGAVIKDLGVTNVTLTGADYVGGLVGSNTGSVINSYSSGKVTGEYRVGGLAGCSGGTVFNSYSSGNVIGSSSVGGLFGVNMGSVNNSHSMGNVIAVDDVGGLVGYSYYGTVSNSYSTGNVNGYSDVGGLVGLNGWQATGEESTVTDSYSAGSIAGHERVGGLVGYSHHGTVSNSYSTGNVTGYSDVGGLVGLNGFIGAASTVGNSYSTGSVTGTSHVGGLLGMQSYLSTVSNSYSTGNVTGYSDVGGLVGLNGGKVGMGGGSTVTDSHSTGSVTGNSSVGGLVGWNYYSSVTDSYSTGSVTGDEGVGGLVGYSYHSTVSNSFWDIQTSGQSTSDGGTGKTTAQMKNIATFSGAAWNITAVALNETNPAYIWNIVNGVTYPFLSWQAI